MRKVEKTIQAFLLEWEELSPLEKSLFLKAAQARKSAQAPYSGYLVGVAIQSQAGKIYAGCNVERATYSETTHGEESAINAMITAEGPAKVAILAGVSGPKEAKISFWPKAAKTPKKRLRFEDLLAPCGRCRQIIWENCFGDPDIPLLWLAPWGEIVKTTIGDLLSPRFGPEKLGIDYRQRS